MISAQNCAVHACVSSFPYKDECGLVSTGCCVRDMLTSLKRAPDGAAIFAMDLQPSGNPFVTAMEAAGLVRTFGAITRLTGTLP